MTFLPKCLVQFIRAKKSARWFLGPESFLWELAPDHSHVGDAWSMGWLRVRIAYIGFNFYWGFHFGSRVRESP